MGRLHNLQECDADTQLPKRLLFKSRYTYFALPSVVTPENT